MQTTLYGCLHKSDFKKPHACWSVASVYLALLTTDMGDCMSFQKIKMYTQP